MSRSRGGPSLFELIGKTSSSLPTQGLARPTSDRGTNAADQPNPGSDPAVTSRSTSPSVSQSQIDDAVFGPTSRSVFSIDGPRLIVSLSSVTTGVCVFLLIVAVGGAYLIGQSRGIEQGRTEGFHAARQTIEQEALDEIAKARNARPNPNVFAGLPTNPVQPNRAAALTGTTTEPDSNASAEPSSTESQPTWIKGQTYIVVQEFLDTDLDQATLAQRFLEQHGVATALFTAAGKSKYRYRLVTQKGFNTDDPVQKKLCNRFHEKIRKLGKRFVEAGGRYDLQGYQKKAVASP